MSQPHPLMTQLKAIRQHKNLTATDLARITGYTAEAHRNWEKGRAVPDLDRFDDLVTALGLRIQLVPADQPPRKKGTR